MWSCILWGFSMSEVPSYARPDDSLAKVRLSAASMTSFVMGLLLCIPVITSLLAIVFAAVGFRATRPGGGSSGRRGRGFAIAGLILGIIGLVIWSGTGALVAFVI